MQIDNCTAVVTGGCLGLGAATASTLASAGCRVFALDLPESIANAPVVEDVVYVEADVTQPDQVQAALDLAADSGAPLRFIVNCAGIAPVESLASLSGHHDLALFRKVIEINLIGTFNVMALGAQIIAATDPQDGDARGVIVNTASIGAFDGTAGTVAYAASKGGVVSLGLPSANDLAPYGIRVMTIAPGTFYTRLTHGEEVQAFLATKVPFPKRLGQPEEFGRLVCDIIANDYLNGELIRLDGAVRMTL